MTRPPVDPDLLQFFYLPAAAFIVTMFIVGATFAVNPSIHPAWPIVVGASLGIIVGALLGAR